MVDWLSDCFYHKHMLGLALLLHNTIYQNTATEWGWVINLYRDKFYCNNNTDNLAIFFFISTKNIDLHHHNFTNSAVSKYKSTSTSYFGIFCCILVAWDLCPLIHEQEDLKVILVLPVGHWSLLSFSVE